MALPCRPKASAVVYSEAVLYFFLVVARFFGASQEFTLADAIDSLRVVRSPDIRVPVDRRFTIFLARFFFLEVFSQFFCCAAMQIFFFFFMWLVRLSFLMDC